LRGQEGGLTGGALGRERFNIDNRLTDPLLDKRPGRFPVIDQLVKWTHRSQAEQEIVLIRRGRISK
jgi:hypothetical protein